MELRTNWEVMQAEKEEHYLRVRELRSLSCNPDTLLPKHVMAASVLKSTQDKGVQGPTQYLGIDRTKSGLSSEGLPDELIFYAEEDGFPEGGKVDEGEIFLQRSVAPGWDRCTNYNLYQVAKGGKAQQILQRDWIKRMRGNRIPASKNHAKNALRSSITLRMFGPTYGVEDITDLVCKALTTSGGFLEGIGPIGLFAALTTILVGVMVLVTVFHRRANRLGADCPANPEDRQPPDHDHHRSALHFVLRIVGGGREPSATPADDRS